MMGLTSVGNWWIPSSITISELLETILSESQLSKLNLDKPLKQIFTQLETKPTLTKLAHLWVVTSAIGAKPWFIPGNGHLVARGV